MKNKFYTEVQAIYDTVTLNELVSPKNAIKKWVFRVSSCLYLIPVVFLQAVRCLNDRRTDYGVALGLLLEFVAVPFIFMKTAVWRDPLMAIQKSITEIDMFLSKFPIPDTIPIRYWLIMRIKIVIVVSSTIALETYRAVSNRRRRRSMLSYVEIAGLLAYWITFDAFIRKFTVFVHFIYRRAVYMTRILENFWAAQTYGWQENVKTLIKHHDLLCGACNVLNSVWSGALVTIVCAIFISLVSSTIHFSTFFGRAIVPHVDDSWQFCTYVTYWIWNLFDITHYAQQCETQIKKFNATLYSLIMSNADIVHSDPEFLDMVLVQLGRKRKIVFTAHGLFPVNNTLVHAVLGSVCTTVIIILQTAPKKV